MPNPALLETELTALKSVVLEQFFLIKKSMLQIKEPSHDAASSSYVDMPMEQIDFLKEENKVNSSIIIQSLTNLYNVFNVFKLQLIKNSINNNNNSTGNTTTNNDDDNNNNNNSNYLHKNNNNNDIINSFHTINNNFLVLKRF